jgi:hypothetical protein
MREMKIEWRETVSFFEEKLLNKADILLLILFIKINIKIK